MVLGLVIGVLIIAGGAVVAADQFLGDGGSPESAVEDFFSAVSGADLLGIADSLVPAEREPLGELVADLVAELKRLEVLGDDFDASGVQGFGFEVDDLELSSEMLRDDLAVVRFEGGTLTSSFDPDRLALGPFLDQFDLEMGGPGEETGDLDGGFLVTVKEAGRWRVSLFHTVAEAARAGGGEDLPSLADALEPVGASSPEEAVRGLVDDMADFDLVGVLARLAPGEARALHEYAPLFVDDLRAFQRFADLGADVRIEDLDFEVTSDGDRALVRVTSAVIEVEVPALGLFLGIDGDCVTFDDGLSSETVCGSDLDEGMVPFFGEFGFIPPSLEVGQPRIGLVAVEVGGSWYVSPIRTMTNFLVESLAVLDREDLDELARLFADPFAFGGGGSFEPFAQRR